MTKNEKYNKSKNRLFYSNIKKSHIKLCVLLLIATVLIVTFSMALTASSLLTSSYKPAGQDFFPATPTNIASSSTQFNIEIAYAYVGAAPPDVTSYLDKTYNASMYIASQYPSVVRLNVTRVPGIQIASCDAEVEVYGVKIAANTGPTEYHAYFIGTSYNSSFSIANKTTLCPYVNNLVDHNVYSEITGAFNFNWTADTCILSRTIGSIGCYTSKPSSWAGLWNEGKPDNISVTVYRIGYVTMNNNSVSIFKDSAKNAISSVQTDNYREGFLYNKLVPAANLSQINIFHPIT